MVSVFIGGMLLYIMSPNKTFCDCRKTTPHAFKYCSERTYVFHASEVLLEKLFFAKNLKYTTFRQWWQWRGKKRSKTHISQYINVGGLIYFHQKNSFQILLEARLFFLH
jgi:hypothetical protein